MAFNSIFDPNWIKLHTNTEKTVTFIFKIKNVPYAEQAAWETVYYDANTDKYVCTDYWGGEERVTWPEFLELLKDVEYLVETSLDWKDGRLTDKKEVLRKREELKNRTINALNNVIISLRYDE